MKTQASHEALIAKPEKKQSDKQRIFALIKNNPIGINMIDIFMAMGIRKQTASARLSELVDEGKIEAVCSVNGYTRYITVAPELCEHYKAKVKQNKFEGIIKRLEGEFTEEWNSYLNSIKVAEKLSKIKAETNFKYYE